MRGIVIDRSNISFIVYPKTPKDGRPRVVLINGEILDVWLTLDFRNFDFTGSMFSFYGTDNEKESSKKATDCVFLETNKINGDSEVIENILYEDDKILEGLLK